MPIRTASPTDLRTMPRLEPQELSYVAACIVFGTMDRSTTFCEALPALRLGSLLFVTAITDARQL